MADVDLIPWWGWVVIWAVLVLAAAAVLALLAWRLVRQGIAVAGDAGRAAERVGSLLAQVETLPPVPRTPPAVLDEPSRLRAERRERLRRARRSRARVVAGRRRLRAAHGPASRSSS